MAAYDTEPTHRSCGVACATHVFAAHVRADPGLVWTALTEPGQSAAYLYGPRMSGFLSSPPCNSW